MIKPRKNMNKYGYIQNLDNQDILALLGKVFTLIRLCPNLIY